MTTTEIPPTDVESAEEFEAAVGAAAEQLLMSVLGSFETINVYIGYELGLYRALADEGPASPGELASRTGIDTRYAREWLEQQTVAGIVEVDSDPLDDDPDLRTFALPAAQVEVLVNRDSLAFIAPFTSFVIGAGQIMDKILDAYRTGGGLSFGEYGDLIRVAQADANRPQFVNLLGSTWLPAMPDVVARLQSDPPALVADVGCGSGWSTIALAKAHPNAMIHGFDLDPDSIADARANAAAEGVADRVMFDVRNAADAPEGAYDLVCMIESLHDTARPTDVLAALRMMAGPDGTVLVVDTKVADEFPGAASDPIERLLYSASSLHCLLVGRSEEHNHATGTMLREPQFRRLAADAGYRTVDVLPIDHDMWRFYRLNG